MSRGVSLVLVGVGYGAGADATLETVAALRDANRVFYLVTDPAAGAWIRSVHAGAESLHTEYREGEPGIAG